MPFKALRGNLDYSVKGRIHKTEEGQIFDESPWDSFMTNKLLSRGYLEEIVSLETSQPNVVLVEEELDLTTLKKGELVKLAESRGLDSTGTKSELLARLSSEEEE
jgi:hypothetical protein